MPRLAGVASVLGTVIFVLVFLLALGALALASGLLSLGALALLLADSWAAAKGAERVDFSGGGAALTVENQGGASVDVNHMIFDYANGTVYAVPVSASIPAGGDGKVSSLLPLGPCSAGNETCASRYDSIASGGAPGSSVGVLTSLGNTFWYYPGGGSAGGSPGYYGAGSVESTTSTSYVGVPGLAFDGGAGQTYVVQFFVGFWQSGPTSNPDMFAVSVPSGTTFLFCGGIDYSTPGASAQPPANACTYQPGVTLGETEIGGGSCITPTLGCEFVGTAFVTFGAAGAFQLEFKGMNSFAANVMADSFLVVTQVP